MPWPYPPTPFQTGQGYSVPENLWGDMLLSNAHVQAAQQQAGGGGGDLANRTTWQHTPGGSLPGMPTPPGVIPAEFSPEYWANQERASNWLQGLNNMPGVLDPLQLTDPANNFTPNTPWQNLQKTRISWENVQGLLDMLKQFKPKLALLP